jgi:hypothetical protein
MVWGDADGLEMAVEAVDKGMIGGGVNIGADAVVGEIGLPAGVAISGGFAVSILDRGDADGACTGDIDPSRLISTAVFAAALRPQNDSNPPPIFLPLPASAACAGPSSTTLQPTGRSSWTTSGRDLTDVSHAVDPFEAISCDIGLRRARGTCLLSRIDSAIDLAVNDLPNGIIGGRVIPSGATRFISAVLYSIEYEIGRKEVKRDYLQTLDSFHSTKLIISVVVFFHVLGGFRVWP